MKRVVVLLALAGCPSEAPPPEPTAPPCDLAYERLPGRTFVREIKGDDGKTWEQDTWARARFSQAGDQLKVRYNTRALVGMYDYTCHAGTGELVCLQDEPDLTQWCQTLIANKGSCSVAELADLTGASVEDATKAYDALMPKVKALSEAQHAAMVTAFSQPDNQLRGVFHVRIDADECRLTARDSYQTMTFGEIREMDNYVGNARFVPTDADLVFEQCADQESLVALETAGASAKPGQTKLEWPAGSTIPFKYVGADLVRPKAGCTYAMDAYVAYSPKTKGAAVAPGADGKLTWAFDHTFQAGRHIVHMYRYEACGGAAYALRDVTCAMVVVK